MSGLAIVLRSYGVALCCGLLLCGFGLYGMVFRYEQTSGKTFVAQNVAVLVGFGIVRWAWRQRSKSERAPANPSAKAADSSLPPAQR